MDGNGYNIKSGAYPSLYNLIIDPKEEEPEKFYLDDTWVESDRRPSSVA
ncbi:MAG: arylsulfatase [Porticoccus sp.]|jgi:arylsulfatase